MIALLDDLTGLCNRVSILLETGRALDRASRLERSVSILVVDLDRFSLVSESLGSAASDRLLQVVADRLVKAARGHDLVARLEWDRFAVLLDLVGDSQEAIGVAARILAALREPVEFEGRTVRTDATIGVAMSRAESTASDLMDEATAALTRAKHDGRGRWEMYDEALRMEAISRMRIETDLRTGIDTGAIRPWYQPIVDLHTGAPTAIEAFVRWHHPQHGVLPPAAFFAIAERAGLGGDLWDLMLDATLEAVAGWRAKPEHCHLGLVLNLSSSQIGQPQLMQHLLERLDHHGVPTTALTIDIRDDVMAQLRRNHAVLTELRKVGVRLALDDFGTGAMPIQSLRFFPVDELKIDSSLTSGMSQGGTDAGLVLALVHMAEALGASVVAEGVERLSVARQLATLGVTRAQGHLLCPVLPKGDMDRLFSHERPFETAVAHIFPRPRAQ